MIFTIILWLSIIWIAPLVTYMLRNETKPMKNIVVGVTLPYEGREDEKVKELLVGLKKQLNWICVFLIGIAIPCLFIRNFNLTMTLWCIWIDLCIVLPYIPYVKCNKALKKIKIEKGWKQVDGEKPKIEVGTIPSIKRISPWLFLPAVLLGLIPLIWDRNLWVLYLVFSTCPIVFWFCYRYLYSNKAESIDCNVQLSQALTQVRSRNWAIMWLISAYSFGALSLGVSLTRDHPVLNSIIFISIIFVVTMSAIRVELNTRKIQEKLAEGSGKTWYIDDDDSWIGGIVYYNPNDSRTIVNCRVGTNSSVNLAKTSGKIIMGITVAMLIALPFTGAFLNGVGSKPIDLEITKTAIVSRNGSTEYSVAYDDIKEIKLEEELPDHMFRTFGTAMENLLKGNYSAKEIGSLKVCVDPNYAPFILITTQGNRNYLFGTRDKELTKEIYKQLLRNSMGE